LEDAALAREAGGEAHQQVSNLRGQERYARRPEKSTEKATVKSEQARQPWGLRACSVWLTVLTPANH